MHRKEICIDYREKETLSYIDVKISRDNSNRQLILQLYCQFISKLNEIDTIRIVNTELTLD